MLFSYYRARELQLSISVGLEQFPEEQTVVEGEDLSAGLKVNG